MKTDKEILNKSIKIIDLPQYYVYKDVLSHFEHCGEIDFIKYGHHEAIIAFKSEESKELALNIKCFYLGESLISIEPATDFIFSEDEYEFITKKERVKYTKNFFEKDEEINEDQIEQQQQLQQVIEQQEEVKQSKELPKKDELYELLCNFNYFCVVLIAWSLYYILIIN